MSCEEGTLCVDCQRELEQVLHEIQEFEVGDLCPDHDQKDCSICSEDDYQS